MNEKERIMQVMAQKGLTSSQFAETIGIQRAAMSHITSGRNNPSLDVMKKILMRFPDISSDWLLMEKGPMLRVAPLIAETPEPKERSANLFTPSPSPLRSTATDGVEKQTVETATPSTSLSEAPMTPDTELVPRPTQIVREVRRIMIFYSDGTFESFVPEKKELGKIERSNT
jgi:DNA-binding protein